MSIYLLTVVVVTAHYTAYSYIEPFVQNIAGFSANFATALLLLLGGAGIIGSVIFGKLGNQYASALVEYSDCAIAGVYWHCCYLRRTVKYTSGAEYFWGSR